MRIEEYFDRIVLINMERRRDRLGESFEQFRRLGIDAGDLKVVLFSGHDMPGDGNRGCTASHRGALELICHHRWQRTLILEDDFHVLHDDCQERFSAMIGEVPDDWEMLYLGGHYAEAPQARVSTHVIRMGHMKTTSSYAVTYEAARKMAPHIYGVGPIDELYCGWHQTRPCYIFAPRLMIQRPGFSDLQGHVMDNGGCMRDTYHEGLV
jgi:GR25 family glycosyltransferase involved in LPS biosynthesis